MPWATPNTALTLDLVSGYWQTPACMRITGEKTAFITQSGLQRVQYDALSAHREAPPLFQWNMDKLLKGLLWKICLVYLDDIVIYSATFEQHLLDLEEVLKRPWKFDLQSQAQ